MAAPPAVRASHAFEEHTAETILRVEAESLPALFAEAGRALADLFGSAGPAGLGAPPGTLAAPEAIHLAAPDLEALLVDFLNELIFRAETGRRIYREVRLDRVEEGAGGASLDAAVRGVPQPDVRTPVKAATMHDVRIERAPSGFLVRVVLDV